MRILIPRGGARESALAWRFKKDGHEVTTDYRANPGMLQVCSALGGPGRHQDLDTPEGLAAAAYHLDFDLTVIGGETLLSQGVVNLFESQGLPIVGPTREAAMLETSKLYCTLVLQAAKVKIPHTEELSQAQLQQCLLEDPLPYVVKFNGLAAGKGAKVVHSKHGAAEAASEMAQYGDGLFLKQEFIDGQEVSFFVATDGIDVVFLGSAADYKQLGPGGPMTGGMGGFAPNPLITQELHDRIMNEVVKPTVSHMWETDAPYRGILYFQLMVTPDGEIYVIEINVRFGDPEAQLLMPLYRGDLAGLLGTTVKGRQLDASGFGIASDLCSVGVVLAAAGYPGNVRKGDVILGLGDLAPTGKVFCAGVRMDVEKDYRLETNGGRVVTAVGVGPDFKTARESAYQTADGIKFDGKQYRADIADHLV